MLTRVRRELTEEYALVLFEVLSRSNANDSP